MILISLQICNDNIRIARTHQSVCQQIAVLYRYSAPLVFFSCELVLLSAFYISISLKTFCSDSLKNCPCEL